MTARFIVDHRRLLCSTCFIMAAVHFRSWSLSSHEVIACRTKIKPKRRAMLTPSARAAYHPSASGMLNPFTFSIYGSAETWARRQTRGADANIAILGAAVHCSWAARDSLMVDDAKPMFTPGLPGYFRARFHDRFDLDQCGNL
jgi:hypothetical protein